MAWAALAAAPIALTIAAATAPLRVPRPPCFSLRPSLGPGGTPVVIAVGRRTRESVVRMTPKKTRAGASAAVIANGRITRKAVVVMTTAPAGARAAVDLQPMLGRAARGDRGARRHATARERSSGAPLPRERLRRLQARACARRAGCKSSVPGYSYDLMHAR